MASCDSTASKEKMGNDKEASQMQQLNNNKTVNAAVEGKVEELVATDTVVIKGMKFNPEELHVKKGATVVWINEGIVPHDVTDFPDKTWTSDTIKIGDSWKKEIDESFDYFCSIHLTMKGKIIVDK